MGEFDHSQGRSTEERILSKLRLSGSTGVKRSELGSSFGSSKEVGDSLGELLRQGLVVYEFIQGPRGRPVEIWWAK